MARISNEQPPELTDADLKEYLSRRFVEVDIALSKSKNFPSVYILPAKPQDGNVEYFGQIIGATITAVGLWGYVDGAWAQLSGGGGGSSKDYGSFYLSTGGITGIAATAVQLNINSSGSNSGVMALSSNSVTVNKTATFDISVNVYLNNSSNSRTEYSMWIEKNNVEIAGTRFASYQRGYDSGMSSGSRLIESLASGDALRVMCQRTDGGSTAGYQDDNGTRLNINEVG
jgi:hypothetical protein